MRLFCATVVAIALAALPSTPAAQNQDADRVVAGGGITVPGWLGKVDARAAGEGRSIADSKFAAEGGDLHLTIGPAAVYWNPANTASGDFTAKATFREAKGSADHPHPYGIFIGGSDLGTDRQRLLYCVAYGDGTYLVRGFSGTQVVTVSKRQPHAAVHKFGADGGVTQEIAWTVQGGRAECAINGATVASFDRSEIVGEGKLASTDGVVGLRVSHNLDVVVSGFQVGK